ncbi:MAG: PDZ domain-containing protein [Pyrinomonadaceae bacterium]|nr:PDZ domain-containing protein [Pyrinomonadaceae bacterium]
MIKFLTKYAFTSLFIGFLILSASQVSNAQVTGVDRDRMKVMLKSLKKQIQKEYYDEKYHGIDLDARFSAAEEKLKNIKTVGEGFSVIAQVLLDFNDSHLYFIPPMTNVDVEYGYRAQMNGDGLYVVTVQPKSDAEAKGLKVGDQILSIEGFRPVKKEMWKVNYFYNTLSKRSNLTLDVLSPGETTPRKLKIDAKIKQRPNSLTPENIFRISDPTSNVDSDKHLFVTLGDMVIWKMPTFLFDKGQVDSLTSKLKGKNKLVLDLRGNGGGFVDTMERLVSYVFDKDIKIADLKGRKPLDPMESKTKGDSAFTGKLVVLIDGRSGSASEIFARLVQLEKRGTVIGETSAGAVLQSRTWSGDSGNDSSIFYGASITHADVIMSDGKSLEHIGVTPDETIILTGKDIADGLDPVLARATEILGAPISAKQAGGFWDFQWRNDGVFFDFAK